MIGCASACFFLNLVAKATSGAQDCMLDKANDFFHHKIWSKDLVERESHATQMSENLGSFYRISAERPWRSVLTYTYYNK